MTIKKVSLFLTGLFFVLALAGCGKNIQKYPIVDENAKLIFFYGNTCPHCKNVEDFFDKNNVTEKVEFSQAEVYTVPANVEVMKKKAQACHLDLNQLGVPMLWNDGQCLVGDQDIINFFQDKIK